MQSASQSAEAHSNPGLKDINALTQQGMCATGKCRGELAAKYLERALALAEATQPADSLVVSKVLVRLIFVRTHFHGNAALMEDSEARGVAWKVAWFEDTRIRQLSRRNIELLVARFDAGTLSRPMQDEADFYELDFVPAVCRPDAHTLSLFGPGLLLEAADNAITLWKCVYDFQSTGLDAMLDLMMRSVAAALRVFLRQCTFHHDGGIDVRLTERLGLISYHLLYHIFKSPYQPLLNACYGLSSSDMSKLLALHSYIGKSPLIKQGMDKELSRLEELTHAAAADVARHGLRRCTLPGCGATEPHPKAFKVCGRCKSTAYCSTEHAAQDWRRHKHAECSRPADA